MSRDSNKINDNEYIYVLIENDNSDIRTSVFRNLELAIIKASSWVDSYYIDIEKEAPRSLPAILDIIKIFKPNGSKKSYSYYITDSYEVIIKRCRIR